MIDLSWIAGFVQGEGCITLYRRRYKDYHYYIPRVSITQKNAQTLLAIQDVVGGYIHKEKNRSLYNLIFSNAKAVAFTKLLLPYLLFEKKAQAEALIEAVQMPAREREAYYWKLRKLKYAY